MGTSQAVPSRSPRRRQGPDGLTRFVQGAAALAWATTLAYLFVLARAQPQKASFLDRAFAEQLRQRWDPEILAQGRGLLVVILGISLLGLAASAQRMRRRGDRYSRSLVVLGAASGIWLVVQLLASA